MVITKAGNMTQELSADSSGAWVKNHWGSQAK
jgi:hypothetical protein